MKKISDISVLMARNKELDAMHGLNEYDYHARQMDPVIGQFNSMDPLCEKYYHISPYAYCAGNPVRYVDPDGKKIKVTGNSQSVLSQLQKLTNNHLVIEKDGMVSIGSGKENVGKSLTKGTALVSNLVNSDKVVTINGSNKGSNYESIDYGKYGADTPMQQKQLRERGYGGEAFDSRINLNLSEKDDVLTASAKKNGSPELTDQEFHIALGHELVHAYRTMNGLTAKGIGKYRIQGLDEGNFTQAPYEELYTVGIMNPLNCIYTENYLRLEQGYTYRLKY